MVGSILAPLRARARITSYVWVLRRLCLARREDYAYSRHGKDEQRRQAGWIGTHT